MMGAVLRAERERRGLTVKDIERETSIRSAYIEALESGRYEALPSEVYVKGFIRNYAEFLRLDAGALVRQYREETHGTEEEPAAAQPRSAGGGDHAPFASGSDFHERVEKSHRAQIILTVTAVVAAAFVGSIYYFFGEDPAAKPPAQTARQETASSAPLPSAETRQDAAQEKPGGAPEAAGQEDVRVRLTGRCWLYVVADGKDVYEGTAEANQTFQWTGKESVVITAGNAGAVEVTHNGKPAGVLGKAGEVVERRFGRSGESARSAGGGK